MEEKKKHKVVIGIEIVLLCMIIAILGTSATSSNPPSNGVSYSKNSQTTVEGALNDLYTKANYGNATAAQILKGKTALVGGKKVIGTYEAPSLTSQLLATNVKVGDYVRYTPDNISYELTKEATGAKDDVIINPSGLNLWRVIRKNSDGTVDIVSENVSKELIEVRGDKGYLYYVWILNSIAKSYENNVYAVGSRSVGYDGSATEICFSSISSCLGDKGYETDIELIRNALGTLEATNSSGDKSSYHLASRLIQRNTENLLDYGVRYIQSDGIIASTKLYSVTTTKIKHLTGSFGIRPIVVLKSTVKLTGGNGNESSPYTLGV